jgi:hypothetical protein
MSVHVMQKKNAHARDWSPLLNSSPDARYRAGFSVDKSPKFPSIVVDDPGRQGNGGNAVAGETGETSGSGDP